MTQKIAQTDTEALAAVEPLKATNTVAETAEFFRVDPRTIREWVRQGKLRVFRTTYGGSGRVIVTKAEIVRVLSEMRQRRAFEGV